MVKLDDGGARVFALPLREQPLTWHEYCPQTIQPAVSLDEATWGGGNAVLVPNGLFLTLANGEFMFDTATPYCQ